MSPLPTSPRAPISPLFHSPAAHSCSLTYCWPHIAIMWCVNSPAKGCLFLFPLPLPAEPPLKREVIRDPLHSLRTLPPSITPFFSLFPSSLFSSSSILLDFSPASLLGTRGRALLCKWYKKEGKNAAYTLHATGRVALAVCPLGDVV